MDRLAYVARQDLARRYDPLLEYFSSGPIDFSIDPCQLSAPFMRTTCSWPNFFDFLSLEPFMENGYRRSRSAPGCSADAAGIEFRGVGFRYPEKRRMGPARILILTIRPGEKIALGRPQRRRQDNLIKLLSRLYDPTEGNDIHQTALTFARSIRSSCGSGSASSFQDFCAVSLAGQGEYWFWPDRSDCISFERNRRSRAQKRRPMRSLRICRTDMKRCSGAGSADGHELLYGAMAEDRFSPRLHA